MTDPNPAHAPAFTADPFGEATSLVPGERAAEYETLRERVIQSVQPRDMIERVWAGDVVDLIWERQRLVRLRSHVIISSRRPALEQILREGLEYGSPEHRDVPRHVRDFILGRRYAKSNMVIDLYQKGYNLASITSIACAYSMDRLERIDRMMAGVERRRDRLLREVERRRKAFAARLREAATVMDHPADHPLDLPSAPGEASCGH